MEYFKNVLSEYVVSYGCGSGTVKITIDEYERIKEISLSAPPAPSGYIYKLRSDNLEWVLVKLPPVEPKPLTNEEALTRYANTLTGASDQTLIEAAETLITERIEEE